MQIVQFKPKVGHKKKRFRSCDHVHVALDEETHLLECQKCNAWIDAFNWLMCWARREEQLDWRLRDLMGQIEFLEPRCEELKKQYGYLKRKGRRKG